MNAQPTKFEKDYYNKLVGKTVESIRWRHMFSGNKWGPVIPMLKFTDGTIAAIEQDPEGNGPGWLEIIEALKGEQHA